MDDATKAQRRLTEIHTELTQQHYDGSKEIPITIAIQLAKVGIDLAEELAKARARNAAVDETIDRALGRLGNARQLISEEWYR
nr:hypothetical protein [Paenibacillus xylanexedens]